MTGKCLLLVNSSCPPFVHDAVASLVLEAHYREWKVGLERVASTASYSESRCEVATMQGLRHASG